MTTGRLRNRHKVAAAVVAGGLLASACGSSKDPLDLGFKRVSLDLVFKDPAKAAPVEPQQVRQVIEYFDTEDPFGSEGFFEEPEPAPRTRAPRRTAPPRPRERECLPMVEGDTPDVPVFGAVKDPPEPGVYTRRNTGSIAIDFPPPLFSLNLPYPPRTTWEIGSVEFDRGTLATNEREDQMLNPGALPPAPVVPEVVRFDITRNVSRTLKTIDTYQYYGDRSPADVDTTVSHDMDGDGLYLVRRETRSTTIGNSIFTPTPPVMMVPIGDETTQTEVNVGAGIDRETNAAMTVTSKVLGREVIDVCGEPVDTYRVQFEERFTDLSSGEPTVGGNIESGKPNIWNIAYSDRLLIAREELHTVTRTNMEVAGAPVPVTVSFDYVSTLDTLQPEPPNPEESAPPEAPAPDEDEEE